jgi:hypothetical protein
MRVSEGYGQTMTYCSRPQRRCMLKLIRCIVEDSTNRPIDARGSLGSDAAHMVRPLSNCPSGGTRLSTETSKIPRAICAHGPRWSHIGVTAVMTTPSLPDVRDTAAQCGNAKTARLPVPALVALRTFITGGVNIDASRAGRVRCRVRLDQAEAGLPEAPNPHVLVQHWITSLPVPAASAWHSATETTGASLLLCTVYES